MKTSFTRKQLGMAVACALALGLASNAARAQNLSDPSQRALVTTQDQQVIKSGFGLCWHSGFGPPPVSTAECDPNYVQASAPVVQRAEPAPAPAPVAERVEPAPQPVVAAAPPPRPAPVAEKLAFEADTLFDFDKAVLRPEGRAALDTFVGRLQDITPETIVAVGHTDRIGSDQYNQRLSEQRVAAVRAYLLDKGVASNRLHTEAKGETQPVTNAADCQGAKSTKVIACLQPDRRVEVEVIGTRIAR